MVSRPMPNCCAHVNFTPQIIINKRFLHKSMNERHQINNTLLFILIYVVHICQGVTVLHRSLWWSEFLSNERSLKFRLKLNQIYNNACEYTTSFDILKFRWRKKTLWSPDLNNYDWIFIHPDTVKETFSESALS